MENEASSKPSSTVFKMGKYTFEYPKDHSKKKPIHKEAIKSIKQEENDTLDISWGKYKRYKWDSLLKWVSDCEVERISAYGNSNKSILRTLSRISFHNLTYLDLGECQIEIIEHLPVGPNLNYLSLINNYIRSVKSLKKFHLPALKTLLLNDNPIKELGVERCDFMLDTYWLERKYNFKTIQECLGQTCLFKIKNEEVKDLSIESITRIYQPNLILKIHDRFPNLQKLFYIEPQDLFESDTQFVVYLTDDDQSEEDNNQVVETAQNITIIENELPEPPALHFVEGLRQEDWPKEIKLIEDESDDQVEELQQGEEEEEREESYDDEQDESDEMEEEEYEETEYESSSCWDSGLEEEEVEEQQGERQVDNQQKQVSV